MSEIKTLHFEGLLRVADNPYTPYVGDAEPVWKNRDVLEELQRVNRFREDLSCAIQVTFPDEKLVVEGLLDLDQGLTEYGTYTPGEPSKFCVGDNDVIEFLKRYDGQQVVIDIAIPGPMS